MRRSRGTINSAPSSLLQQKEEKPTSTQIDVNVNENLKELVTLVQNIQDERDHSENTLSNIEKTHEKIQQEQKVSQYYKQKLKGLYETGLQDASGEIDALRIALKKIQDIKEKLKVDSRGGVKPILRRGVLMSMLLKEGTHLPLWASKVGEKAPMLCGAIQADTSYISQPSDHVAAKVKGGDGEENWILAQVVSYNPATSKYDIDDVDAEDGKERHTLGKRRIIPLPKYKANPETDIDAVFPINTIVYALYPQTTCFYRGMINEIPKLENLDYSILFEDNSYPNGYSPPLMVSQRYVIICRHDKKK